MSEQRNISQINKRFHVVGLRHSSGGNVALELSPFDSDRESVVNASNSQHRITVMPEAFNCESPGANVRVGDVCEVTLAIRRPVQGPSPE